MNLNTLHCSADTIQAWRDTNPSRRLTFSILREAIGVSYLTGMSLTNANLTNADLTGANLTNADLTGANLTNADLTGAMLINADLHDVDLTGANLTNADLTGAMLINADLTGAMLINADLTGAMLINADLTGANLYGANLTACAGGVAQIINVYPYLTNIQPTPDGWYVRVSFWYGTLDALHDIATSDDEADWPEECGGIREERQPLLQAILGVFDAHVANHPNAIDRLAERWGYQECAC